MALLFSTELFAAFSIQGTLRNFNFYSCGQKNCIEITAKEAFTGNIPSNYAFDSALIVITDRSTKKTTNLNSQDVYLDSIANKLFIRQLPDQAGTQGIYDLVTEKLSIFQLQK